MSSIAAMDIALPGIRRNVQAFERLAERVAVEAPGGDLAGTMVGLMTARAGVAANAQVVRTADEVLGTLLDILA